MSVKELRQVLTRWDATCVGCAEKADYLGRIAELRTQYGDRDGGDAESSNGDAPHTEL